MKTLNEMMKFLNEIKESQIMQEVNRVRRNNKIQFENETDVFLYRTFPNSEIHYTYSLEGIKKDSFNIYGYMDIKDALNFCNMNYSDIEIDMFKDLIFSNRNGNINIINKNAYNAINVMETYQEKRAYYYFNDVWETDEFVDINSFCKKNKILENKLNEKLLNLCEQMKNKGYKYLYEDVKKQVESK